MTKQQAFPPDAFAKADQNPDAQFYGMPRFVAHIDDRAIAAVTDLYRRTLAPDGTVLDLMSSWISHLPPDVAYASVTGLGLNAGELAANPRLTRRLVHDLNADPVVPLDSVSFDGAAICVSVQYLQHPIAVMAEVLRVLRPAAPLAITFSDRCFPTKAVAIWTALRAEDRPALVSTYLARAGFVGIEAMQMLSRDSGGDPLWAVIGRRPA